MYGQPNYGGPPVGQGLNPSQSQTHPTYQQHPPGPNAHFQPRPQPGPSLYQHVPFPGVQAPIGTPSASHFRPQNVSHNPTAVAPQFHGQPRGGLLPPPPPRRNEFYPVQPLYLSGGAQGVQQIARGFSAAPHPHQSCPPPVLTSTLSEEENANPPPLKPVEAEIVQGIEESCKSAGDSDMEMEDDITIPEKDQDTNRSTNVLVKGIEVGAKDIKNAPQILAQRNPALGHDISIKFPSLGEKSEGLTSNPALEVHSQVVEIVHSADFPLDCNIEKNVCLGANNLSPSIASLTADTTNSKTQSELIKTDSPMRLIQAYVSDDSSENDDELFREDPKPSRVLPSLLVAESVSNKDTGSFLEADKESKNRNDKKRGSISTWKADGSQDNRSSFRKAHGTSKRGNTEKESEEKKAQSESASQKVDEFGRTAREASSDSDSDSKYANRRKRRIRRGRSRSRSHSRSRSPLDRRTQRSSRRRRDERSRSRSWSPRNRRSRSRSPMSRSAGEFSRGKFRSNKFGRGQQCIDFSRGKCHRGASCRYTHEVDKSNISRSHRSNQKPLEIQSDMRNRKTKKEESKRSSVYDDDTPIPRIQDRIVDMKRDVITNTSQTTRELKIVLNKPDAPSLKIPDYKTSQEKFHEPQSVDILSEFVSPLVTVSTTNEPRSNASGDQMGDDSSVFDSILNQTTLTSSKNIPKCESVPNNFVPTMSQPTVSGLTTAPFPGPPISHEFSQLPGPPPRPPLPIGYGSVPHSAPYTFQFGHGMNPQTYQVPVSNQHPQFSIPPNSSWSLPPPPPLPRPPYDLRFTPNVSSQFQPSHFSKNEFGSQVSEFLHQSHPSNQEPLQHSSQLENTSSGYPRGQLGPLDPSKDGQYSHPSVQELSASTSLGLEKLSSQELYVNTTPTPPTPPPPLSKSSTETHSFSHVQQVSSHLPYSLANNILAIPGKSVGVLSQYPPDLEDNNQLSSASDFGLPRIVPHHNPYASTFEQPLSSKFSSGFSHEKVSLSENQDNIPLRLATSSPSSARAQYDPLFDSVEPVKTKEFRSRNWDLASDSHNKPLDMDETSRHEDNAVASTTSLDDDEFGETAEAEVGAVENESLSDIAGVGLEMETESKSPGKKKNKKKDSRSAKPFKMAIADFVKDVLKPSWRQGNMSKEAFKTIVKKTVDKVSGAMKGHSVPKSQSKIDQYIDSSQRKLTKLVLGYVDKYVKV